MILIICEKYRISKAVAEVLKATEKLHHGIYANDDITVAFVRKNFISFSSLEEMAGGALPYVPGSYRMRVTDKETDRMLKRLFHTAKEVVFASPEGAEAQARFFNLCRHFRVGQPTSRMWLTRLDSGSIKTAYFHREKGRVLHDLAQSGLVAKGTDLLFGYNFSRVLDRWFYDNKTISRKEAVAMAYIGRLSSAATEMRNAPDQYRIHLNTGGLHLVSEMSFSSEVECAHAASEITVGETVNARLSVTDATPKIHLHTMLTLQMDAFDNLGFMPSKTLRTATRLFEAGLITSPYTDGDGHHITITGPLLPTCSKNEYRLYNLIQGRMLAVAMQSDAQQSAIFSVEIAGMRFARRWQLKHPKPEYIGSSEQEYEITSVNVLPERKKCQISFAFSAILANLHRYYTTNTCSVPRIPYCEFAHEWGTVLESLAAKGFIEIADGNIRLTSEGNRLVIDIDPYELENNLLCPSFDPGMVLIGKIKGRNSVKHFEDWLTHIVGSILKYVPKEEIRPVGTIKTGDVEFIPEK